MIRVLIADDHAIMRAGVKQLFALGKEIAVVEEAVNGQEVLDALQAGGIDLVLLDMTMPGVSGVNLIQRIRSNESNPPILVLSMHNELPTARLALAAGAAGYLTKDNKPETLIGAILTKWLREEASSILNWQNKWRSSQAAPTSACRMNSCPTGSSISCGCW